LRISGELTGHRYLFGLLALGGLLCDLQMTLVAARWKIATHVETTERTRKAFACFQQFLDRLEEWNRRASKRMAYGLLDYCARIGTRARFAKGATYWVTKYRVRCAQ